MLEQLIKNAEKLKGNKKEKLHEIKINRFIDLGIEGTVKIKRPDTVLLTSYAERKNDINYLISESVVEPDLSNNELQNAFGAKTKIELVKKLFTPSEISDLDVLIGRVIRENRAATLVDDLKN